MYILFRFCEGWLQHLPQAAQKITWLGQLYKETNISNAYFLIPVKATSKVAWVWQFTFAQGSSGNSVHHQDGET